jgi:type I restriction enzyme, S subunit
LPTGATSDYRPIIDRHLSVVEPLEAAIERSLQRAARLRQSILKQAFEGKLVPQDPNDKPASVLLERIRAERAQSEPQRGSSHEARKGEEDPHAPPRWRHGRVPDPVA